MTTRLRQLALVAGELEPVVDDLCGVLGLEISVRDPGVAEFGLVNAVMPVGDSFLEVVSPARSDASAARFRERRGGDGGYMVILQVDDLAAERKRLTELGVRIVWEVAFDDIATIHLHPRDVGGAIVSLDSAHPRDSWRWAGPDWRRHRRTDRSRRLLGAEIQSSDPDALARSWSRVLGLPLGTGADSRREIPLEGGHLRFVEDRDGRGEGMTSIQIEVADRDAVVAAARRRGLPHGDLHVRIGGVRFDLVGGPDV